MGASESTPVTVEDTDVDSSSLMDKLDRIGMEAETNPRLRPWLNELMQQAAGHGNVFVDVYSTQLLQGDLNALSFAGVLAIPRRLTSTVIQYRLRWDGDLNGGECVEENRQGIDTIKKGNDMTTTTGSFYASMDEILATQDNHKLPEIQHTMEMFLGDIIGVRTRERRLAINGILSEYLGQEKYLELDSDIIAALYQVAAHIINTTPMYVPAKSNVLSRK
jgi:hypothetical protein